MLRSTRQVLSQSVSEVTEPRVSIVVRKASEFKFVVPDYEVDGALSNVEFRAINGLNSEKTTEKHIDSTLKKLQADLQNPRKGHMMSKQHDMGIPLAKKSPTKLSKVYERYNPTSTLHTSLPDDAELEASLKRAGYVPNEGIPFSPKVFDFLCEPVTFTHMYRTLIRGTKPPSQKFVQKMTALEAINADSATAIPLFVDWVNSKTKKFHIFAMADFALRLLNTVNVKPGALEALLKMYLAIPEDRIIRDQEIPLHAPDYLRAWFAKVRGTAEDLDNPEKLKHLHSVQQLDVDLAGLREYYFDVKDSLDNLVLRYYHVLLSHNIQISDEIEAAYLKALLRSGYSHDAVAFVMNRLRSHEVNPDYIEMILGVTPQVNASPIVPHLLRILQVTRGYATAEDTFAALKPEVQLALVSAFHRADVVYDPDVAYRRFKLLLEKNPNKALSKAEFDDLLSEIEEEISSSDEYTSCSEYESGSGSEYESGSGSEYSMTESGSESEHFARPTFEYDSDMDELRENMTDWNDPEQVALELGSDLEPFDGETVMEKLESLKRAAFDQYVVENPDLVNQFNPDTALTPRFPVSIEQLLDGSPAMYLFGKSVEAGVVPHYDWTDFSNWFDLSATVPILDLTQVEDPCMASTMIAHSLYEMSDYAANNPNTHVAHHLKVKLPIDAKVRDYYEKISSIKTDMLSKDPAVKTLVENLENLIGTKDVKVDSLHSIYAQINNRIVELMEDNKEALATVQGASGNIIDLQYQDMVLQVFDYFEISKIEVIDGHAIIPASQLDSFVTRYNAM